MKLKVMLVDDEQPSVKYLSELINWDVYGMELTPSAANGKDALALFRKHQPDIVITDITMPVMNGLELASAIRNLSENTYIVFLTSYDDFAYARDAVRIGAADYVLKTEISQSWLLQKMLSIRATCLKTMSRIRSMFEYEVGQFFAGGSDQLALEEMDPRIAALFRKEFFCAVAERDDPLSCLTDPAGLPVPAGLDFNEIKALCDSLEGEDDTLSIARLSGSRFLLLYRGSEETLPRRYQQFCRLIGRVDETLRLNMQKPFTIFTFNGEYRPEIFQRKYLREEGRFRQKYFADQNRVIAMDELPEAHPIGKRPDFAPLRKALEEYAREEAGEAISDLLGDALLARDTVYLEEALSGSVRLLQDIFGSTIDVSAGEEASIFENGCEREWFQYESAAGWLRRTAARMLHVEWGNQTKSYSRSVLDAIEYIRQHYGNAGLDVEEISENTHMSKSWLSVQFKQETGKTLIEYLTQYRIAKARKLIDDHYKIYETASMTGFSSTQYFCKVFKKYEGVSPVEYKNRKTGAGSKEDTD